MTARDDFDRLLTVWLDETAGASVPDYLDETLSGISRLRQRPVWASPRRWLPMELTRVRPHVPRAVPILALIAVVIVALVAATLFIGSQRRLPPPFGLAATGLFVYDSGGDLYLATATGDVDLVLTRGTSTEFGATFSRDGTRIAYWSVPASGPTELWVTDADAEGATKVVGDLALEVDTVNPAVTWSPDGRSFAFSSAAGQLFVANADGSSVTAIGDDQLLRFDPAWSPDGGLLAFRGEPTVGGPAARGVFVIRPDGSAEERISGAPGSTNPERRAQWAPDGTRLVYHMSDAVDNDIYVASRSAEGWIERRLEPGVTDGPTLDSWPTWSNDGNHISFIRSDPSDHGYLVVADPDGSNERRLDSRLIGWAPHCWTPDDRSIMAVTAEQNVGIGDESDPGYIAVSVDGSQSPVVFPTEGRAAFAACSWQRLAP